MASIRLYFKLAVRYRNFLLALVIPILLLPLPLTLNDQRATCGYLLLVMAFFWLFQVMPIAMTGVLPFFVLPMLGILTPEEVAAEFLKDFTLTFMVGFMVACGMEKSGLHKRFALRILLLTGSKQYLLLIGLMLPTFLLSMWISNMAVCVMMVAIAEQVIINLKREAYLGMRRNQQRSKQQQQQLLMEKDEKIIVSKSKTKCPAMETGSSSEGFDNEGASFEPTEMAVTPLQELSNHQRLDDSSPAAEHDDNDDSSDDESARPDDEFADLDDSDKTAVDSWFQNLQACFVLGVAYSAKVGGACTLSGTNSNLRAKDLTDEIWREHGFETSPINFSSWMVLNVPAQSITLVLIWLWFCVHFFWWGGCSLKPGARKFARVESARVREFLRNELNSLGKMSYSEYLVLFMLTTLILLWFFLNPDFMKGWATFFPSGYVTVSAPSAMILVAMMLVPGELAFDKSDTSTKPVGTLSDYQEYLRTYPWALLSLTGGGNALAEAMTRTGLSDWIAEGLTGMDVLPDVVLMLILSLMVTLFTEVIADLVSVTIFVPIAAQLAENIGKNPLYLIFPVSLSATYSFMLPVAGAVNAWILSCGLVSVSENIRVGAVINVVCVLVTLLSMHTWGAAYFDLDTIPWANENSTVTTAAP